MVVRKELRGADLFARSWVLYLSSRSFSTGLLITSVQARDKKLRPACAISRCIGRIRRTSARKRRHRHQEGNGTSFVQVLQSVSPGREKLGAHRGDTIAIWRRGKRCERAVREVTAPSDQRAPVSVGSPPKEVFICSYNVERRRLYVHIGRNGPIHSAMPMSRTPVNRILRLDTCIVEA